MRCVSKKSPGMDLKSHPGFFYGLILYSAVYSGNRLKTGGSFWDYRLGVVFETASNTFSGGILPSSIQVKILSFFAQHLVKTGYYAIL